MSMEISTHPRNHHHNLCLKHTHHLQKGPFYFFAGVFNSTSSVTVFKIVSVLKVINDLEILHVSTPEKDVKD